MIIVDEAHCLPADQWQEILTNLNLTLKCFFFTAMPLRADGEKITDDLPEVCYAYELTRDETIRQLRTF